MKAKLTVTALTLLLSVTSQAQPARDVMEKAGDRQELRRDARERRDDRRDLMRLEDIAQRLAAARNTRGRMALAAVDHDLAEFMREEWWESGREVRESQRELGRDVGEVRSERREVRTDIVAGSPGAFAHDRRDLRDDRRDLRDDARDARAKETLAYRIRQIALQLQPLYGRIDMRSLNRKQFLVGELLSVARAELAQDRHEGREDRRELREDLRRP